MRRRLIVDAVRLDDGLPLFRQTPRQMLRRMVGRSRVRNLALGLIPFAVFAGSTTWAVAAPPQARRVYVADHIGTNWSTDETRDSVHAEFVSTDGPLPAFRIPLGTASRRPIFDPNTRVAGHVEPVEGERREAVKLEPAVPAPAAEEPPRPVPKMSSTTRLVTPPEPEPVPVMSRVDELDHFLKGSLTSQLPTVIYANSTVTICVPQEMAGTSLVTSVMVRGLSESVAGTIFRASVIDRRAVLRGLLPGAYEILYLDSDDQPVESRLDEPRRLIVELESMPDAPILSVPALPDGEPSRWPGSTAATAPLSPLEIQRINEAVGLIDRGAAFSALSILDRLILERLPRRGRSAADGDPDLGDLFGGTGGLAAEIASERVQARPMARRIARELGYLSELAPAFYGLARAYEVIESEPRPLVSQASILAEVSLLVAHELDPALIGPMRDLAIRKIDQKKFDDALDCLHRALALAPDAEAHFLMGQWLSREGNDRQAADAYRQSIRFDPYFLPASFELARLEVDSRAGALYGDEVRDLAIRLREFVDCELLSPTDRAWAKDQLGRIAWLAREADLNQSSYTARRWIPRHVRWIPSQGPRGKAIAVSARTTLPEESLPPAPARIPIAIPARSTVTAAGGPNRFDRPTSKTTGGEVTQTAATAAANQPVIRAVDQPEPRVMIPRVVRRIPQVNSHGATPIRWGGSEGRSPQ